MDYKKDKMEAAQLGNRTLIILERMTGNHRDQKRSIDIGEEKSKKGITASKDRMEKKESQPKKHWFIES